MFHERVIWKISFNEIHAKHADAWMTTIEQLLPRDTSQLLYKRIIHVSLACLVLFRERFERMYVVHDDP
jgi:hypothetical protein